MNIGVARDRIHKRVSLIVQVIDDFTEKPLSGSRGRIWIPGNAAPIVKTEGYYVFVNIREPAVELHVENPLYHPRQMTVYLAELGRTDPIIKVRLLPNRCYPIPSGTTCIKGKAEPGSQIRVLAREKGKILKLLVEYGGRMSDDRRRLTIYNPDNADLDGRCFLIEDKDKKHSEYFTVARTLEGETKSYLLSQPLLSSYKKIGTSIYPVHITQADEEGNFFLLLSGGTGDRQEYRISAAGTQQVSVQCELQQGKVNEVHLIREV